jgi:hypothetical protein
MWRKLTDSHKGNAPKALRTSQKNTVTKKPSLVLNSPFFLIAGSQNNKPESKVIAKAIRNVEEVDSP